MFDYVKKFMYTGIGMVSMTFDRFEEYFDDLQKETDKYKKEGKKVFDKWTKTTEEKREDVEERVKDTTNKILSNLRFPTQSELDAIKKRLDSMEAKVGSTQPKKEIVRTAKPKA